MSIDASGEGEVEGGGTDASDEGLSAEVEKDGCDGDVFEKGGGGVMGRKWGLRAWSAVLYRRFAGGNRKRRRGCCILNCGL